MVDPNGGIPAAVVNRKRPFPLLPHASTTDPAVIRDNDWAAFRELEYLANHWTIKSWAPGRTGYYWYLTFDDPELSALVSCCQQRLGDHEIDFVPQDGLHLTLLGLGRADEISDQQLGRITADARDRLVEFPIFDLAVGPLAGSRSALRFSVTPWAERLDLHRLLREVTAAYIPTRELGETSSFRPHLGIGYLNKASHAATLIAGIEALRGLPPVTVSVTGVELVELRREGQAYRWTVQADFRLGDRSRLGRREPAGVRRPSAQ